MKTRKIVRMTYTTIPEAGIVDVVLVDLLIKNNRLTSVDGIQEAIASLQLDDQDLIVVYLTDAEFRMGIGDVLKRATVGLPNELWTFNLTFDKQYCLIDTDFWKGKQELALGTLYPIFKEGEVVEVYPRLIETTRELPISEFGDKPTGRVFQLSPKLHNGKLEEDIEYYDTDLGIRYVM